MKINEILLESEVQNLEEGPILNKIGTAVGKGVGAVAKGAGAVAGGVAGLGAAAKKGFQAGKQTVAGAGDEPADPNAAAPAQEKPQSFMAGLKQGLSGKKSAPATTAQDINAQGPKGTAPAKNQTGAGAQAIAKTAQAAGGNAEKAGQTLYAQVKSQVNQLDKKGKQRIMQLLQKSLQQTPAADANKSAGGGAMGQVANQLANTGASSTGGNTQGTATGVKHTANPNNPNNQQAAAQPDDMADISDAEIAKSTAAKTDDQLSRAAGRTNLNPRVKASVDAEIAKRGGGKKPVKIAGNKQAPAEQPPQQLQASKENTGTMVAEGFSLFRKH
jgi:hypothetical protein